jgi:hypothetical protein
MKLIFVAFLIAVSAVSAHAQVALGAISATTDYAPEPILGNVVYLDLRLGHFTPVVTELSEACRKPSVASGQVTVRSTHEFSVANRTLLAITANSGPEVLQAGQCGTPAGVVISRFKLVNPGETAGPTLYFRTKNAATITSDALPGDVQWAVAGSTVTNNDCADLHQPGTLLVYTDNAGNIKPGVCPIPKSASKAARGAAGIDASGTILIIAVMSGVEGSSGLKTVDMAYLMMGLGAHWAVNFDGGGSTTLFWTPEKGNAPPVSPDAVALRTRASSPIAQSPNHLKYTVTPHEPADPITFDMHCPKEPYTPGCVGRAIFASLGFHYTPDTAKR